MLSGKVLKIEISGDFFCIEIIVKLRIIKIKMEGVYYGLRLC